MTTSNTFMFFKNADTMTAKFIVNETATSEAASVFTTWAQSNPTVAMGAAAVVCLIAASVVAKYI